MLEDLKKDLVEALKSKEALKAETIRMILASIHNEEIAKGKDKELKEEDVTAVIRREAKKRREAAEIYKEAGRAELAEKEEKELEIIKEYLPPEMSGEEILSIIEEAAEEGDNFGKVMGQVMAKVAGRAEPGRVSEMVKKYMTDAEAQTE